MELPLEELISADPGAWVLVVGTSDRRLARSPATVLMLSRLDGVALPRDAFALAVWVGPADVADLAAVRNAVRADGHVLVLWRAADLDRDAERAGFSRRRARDLRDGFAVLELSR